MVPESCFSLTIRTHERARKTGGLRVSTKAPDALLIVCAIAVLGVATWLYASVDSDTLGVIPSEPKIFYEIREPG
ncbi:MAG: hypothetical protein H0T57_13315 [Rubrobacter sp.]|nr:hypothetical protein [Rubrobacter sp.]